MSPLSYCKLCQLEDFAHPELRELMREMHGHTDPADPYPEGAEHRKDWEVAMTARALRDLGAIGPEAEILGVGAGREKTIYWLTRYVRRVFATDLYANEDDWSSSDSGVEMLFDPGRDMDLPWNPRRLVVQHMNGTNLQYEDESFDGIFSSGSIEHFGDYEDIHRSCQEMHRVLKPGGVAALATEFRLTGDPPGFPGTYFFNEEELRSVVMDGLDWELASPLELVPADVESIPISDLIRDAPPPIPPNLRKRIAARIEGKTVEWEQQPAPPTLPTPYPHILVHHKGYQWTSVHVALVKPG